MKIRSMKLIAQRASGRRDERHPEAVHLPEQLARELQAELIAPVGEQDGPHAERPDEVPDDCAGRALVQADDEQDGHPDGDQDVRDAREHELGRALLDPEERGQLLVVHLRPQPDEGGADEPRVVPELQRVGDRLGEDEADDQPGGRHRHREPEGGAHDKRPVRLVLRVEVEAEERARDPHPQDDHEHRRQRDDRLDLPEALRAEVVRVEREEEDREDPGDEPAEPVHGRVLAEPLDLRAEGHCYRRA